MIPQPFLKGSGEKKVYGKYEYVPGASLVYDWGNPVSYNPAQGAGGITSNVYGGGEPQGVMQNSGGGAASMWTSTYEGIINFNASSGLQVEYNSTFPTGAMSVVSVYRPEPADFRSGSIVGLQNNNGINLVVGGASRVVTPTIYYGASGNTVATLSCSVTLSTTWNVVTFTTNGLNKHTLYLGNGTINSVDTGTYNRGLFSPTAQNIRIGKNATSNNWLNGIMMAYMVYPFELSIAQIRRNNYVFLPRLKAVP